MINHSRPEYIFIRTCIFGLQAITPVSIAWTILRAVQLALGAQWLPLRPLLPLDIWFAAETAFYIFIQRPIVARIQQPAEHPPLMTENERHKLFERFTEDVSAAEFERHLRGWFRGAEFEEIGKDEVKSWLAWAFFEGRVDEDDPEIDEYATRLEKLLSKHFAQGHGSAKPIRLTLDPVQVSHRSLAWYFTIGIVDSLVYLQLRWYGFHHYRMALRQFFTLWPLRPLTLTNRKRSPAKHLTYWLRPHTSKTRLPIVFVHGIGIGLYPYVEFLHDLNKGNDLLHPSTSLGDDGEIGILAIELMPISFRLTHSALSRTSALDEISQILSNNNYDNFVLVAHSYGTIIATHMLRDPRLSPKISSLVLVDPVCFLLHQPSVAYNFTVRKPKKANEWQLWYFASKDWGVAHTLGRRFFWRENVLWREEVDENQARRVTIGLAGRDLIVETEDVGRFLTGAHIDDQHWKGAEWKGEGLEVLWNMDKDHAQVFEKGWMRDRLVGVVREYTRKFHDNVHNDDE